MKKIPFFIGLLLIPFLLSGCTLIEKPVVYYDTDKTDIKDNYVGSYTNGNYVWGGAMNLAWNELNENIIHEKLILNTTDGVALSMVDKFNNPIFTKNDLDEKSYYIKSGFGQETVNAINKESRIKFPTKSFADLSLQLGPTDIISYAYFLKEIEYKNEFVEKDFEFNGTNIVGFEANQYKLKKNIKVVKYENDNKFIISLDLKDNSDQMFLVKGFSVDNINNVITEINSKPYSSLNSLDSIDTFMTPKLKLDYNRNYTELINKSLKNKGFEDYYISDMFENIKFDMDKKGARVENEGVIAITKSAINPYKDTPKPKNFILNKPYLVIMKRSDSKNPYFILGINNTELMEKK